MTKYLGIDYGLSHIGLATSEAILATPLSSLHNDSSIFIKLNNVIKTESITDIICGIPEGKLVPVIEKFAKDLHEFTGIPVTLHPETLSSQEAIAKLVESGASRAKKKNDHAYAACLILEDFLEFHK
ncbi:MAG: Holliday junction resolvase RuvX [Microgenomates group bacterium]